MTCSAVSRFPQELIDKVIDHVRWNGPYRSASHDILVTYLNKSQVSKMTPILMRDLGTCSLISRAWLPRSRYYLFYHVTLRADRHQSPRFLKLLGSARGTIAPSVRHLELHEGKATEGWEKIWLNKALPRLTVMTAIESVYISDGNFERLKDATIAACFSSFGRVTYLRLECCLFSSPLQFLNILSSSPHLEHLVLVSVKAVPESSSKASMLQAMFGQLKVTVRAKNEAGPVSASVTPRPQAAHLRVLEISECGFMEEFLTWLQSGVQVDTLLLNTASADDIPAHSELIRMLGSSLTDLNIDFSTRFEVFQSVAADAFIHEVNLTGNDHLRAIWLPPATIRAHHPDVGAAGRFPQFLAQISSPRIEEVFMDITVTWIFQLNVVDWDTIGQIFKRPNFLHLRRVLVTIHTLLLAYWNLEFRDKALTWLEDKLPDCHTRGILEIKWR